MHASISMHICAEYLDPFSGQWKANATCFDHRLRNHPQRLENIFFNYVLVSRAIGKVRPFLEEFSYCSGDVGLDALTLSKVKAVAERAGDVRFDERPLFADAELKDDFRNRFRNISSLMDCVGCDKCRLWGKVQTAGYGAALKILFGVDERVTLTRQEVIALFNTYGRLSNSLRSLREFGYGYEDDPVEVDMPGVVSEEAIPAPSENPHAESSQPRSHLDWLTSKLSLSDKASSLKTGFLHELGEFRRALKIIFRAYYNTPRMLWHYLFVARPGQESALWRYVQRLLSSRSRDEL